MEVLFGGEPAQRVSVLRSNLLVALSPASPVPAVRVRMTPGASVTFAAGPAPTLTRDSGSWGADGFVPGSRIVIGGTTLNDTAGDGLLVASVAGLVLTLDAASVLVAEGPVAGVSVQSLSYGEGAVDLTLRNLDDSGVPIPGEELVLPQSFQYQRPQLSSEVTLRRVSRQLVREVRRQVLATASMGVHVDWSRDDLLGSLGVASLPAVVLLGPDIAENRFFSVNSRDSVDTPADEVELRRAPYTVDATWEVLFLSNLRAELQSLMQAWVVFVDRNPYLSIDRDPDDLALGKVRYEFDIPAAGEPTINRATVGEDVVAATGSVVLRGIDLEGVPGFEGEMAIDLTTRLLDIEAPVSVGVSQTGVSYPVGPSPGGAKCP